jgi:hypothetical protein
MRTLDINMVFWTDGLQNSTRVKNVLYTIEEAKRLTNFLSKEINCNFKVFDYSETRVISDSIHIPYPKGVFKKSEKINHILSNCSSEMFSIIDSDCFVNNNDYEKLLKLVLDNWLNSCITFDVLDFSVEGTNKILNEKHNPNLLNTTSRFPGRAGGLGAFFITNTENLKKHGGFDTKFTTWGGEDGFIYDQIDRDGAIKKIPVKNDFIKLYHLWHFSDRENINYFNSDEYIKNNY